MEWEERRIDAVRRWNRRHGIGKREESVQSDGRTRRHGMGRREESMQSEGRSDCME